MRRDGFGGRRWGGSSAEGPRRGGGGSGGLARVPYTGSGVAASAVSMSKVLAKRIVASVGVPCAPDTVFEGEALAAPAPPAFGFPLVVKPDRGGSTAGGSVARALGGGG